MKTQTAVEWFIEQCPRIKTIAASSVLEQAKEIEKQQIEEAWQNGWQTFIDSELTAEQYYNETFKTTE